MKKYKRIMRLSIIVLLLAMQYNTSVFAIDHLSINQEYNKSETHIMFLNPFTINDEETNEDDNQGRKSSKARSSNAGKGQSSYNKNKVKEGRFVPPGLQKKASSPSKSNASNNKNKKFSLEWTGQLLSNLEPIKVDEALLNHYNVPLEESDLFEKAYPSVLPIENTYVTSDYGMRKNPTGKGNDFHEGVDLKANYQPVWASGSGQVIFTGYKEYYGYTVIIDHGYGFQSLYAHNSELFVSVDDYVDRYTVIALSGNSGNSTGPHLHYEIRYQGESIDPIKLIFNR